MLRNTLLKAQAQHRLMTSMTQYNGLLSMQMRQFALIKRFTESHEWIELDTDSGEAKIGITNHAQSELGDIVHVDMPEAGTEFEKKDTISCLESTKTAADIYQMCDGVVTDVNNELEDKPELINEDPEGEGWIFKVKVND